MDSTLSWQMVTIHAKLLMIHLQYKWIAKKKHSWQTNQINWQWDSQFYNFKCVLIANKLDGLKIDWVIAALMTWFSFPWFSF